jgi:predicted RNA-binding protein with RPS1 domain
MKSSDLFATSSFQEACHVRKVYVHISKAFDETHGKEAKDSAALGKFHKEFAPATKHPVRILNTSHWMEGVAAGGCAPSILEAHVLTHEDLEAGKVYKQVPICAHLPGGSVMVLLGGSGGTKKQSKAASRRSGISGLIPPDQLFDATSSAKSEYRQRVFQTKFGLDAKVDVRVLWVDMVRKRCLVTAKKSIVQAAPEEIITSYNNIQIGQVAVGFISKIDDQGLYVTFCNKVYGKVTARSLAVDLGVENHKENYSVGDVVTCRVVKLKRVCQNGRRFSSIDDNEMDGEDENETQIDGSPRRSPRLEYWELTLSLKVQMENGDENTVEAEIDVRRPQQVKLQAGAILPAKSMKIVDLVDGRQKEPGGYVPGHAVVSVKSKYVLEQKSLQQGKMLPDIECKLPYSQLLDSFDPADLLSAETLDHLAKRTLTLGKKINQKGIILFAPRKSNVDFSSGIGKMPIVSLRKKLIQTKEGQDSASEPHDEGKPFLPSPDSGLFIGALVLGFVVQIDPKHGAFVRFLDGLTGLVPKKGGGLRLGLYDTIVTHVKAVDDSSIVPRILLEPIADHLAKDIPSTSVKIGDRIPKAKVIKINFHQATLEIPNSMSNSNRECFVIHCTCKDSSILTIKHRKKPLPKPKTLVITKRHPFYGMKSGQELVNLTVVAVEQRKGRVDIFVTDRDLPYERDAPLFVKNDSQLKPGMTTTAVVVGYGAKNKGLFVQVGPSVKAYVPGLELSRDLNVLNDMKSNVPMGAVLECQVLDLNEWRENRSRFLKTSRHKKSPKKLGDDLSKKSLLFLSVLACEARLGRITEPSNGELTIARINRSLPPIRPPSLMLELRGGFVARCCITELDEPDDWENMPLGHPQKMVDVKLDKHEAEDFNGMDVDSEQDDDSLGSEDNAEGEESG